MFKIKIAEMNINIDNVYQTTERFCKGYIIKEEHTDFSILSTIEKIEKEKTITLDSTTNEMCEITSVYREICDKALAFNTLFIHASAINYDNDAILFLALSGTGKSTHARMWKETFPEHVGYINDDKPLLRIIDNKWYACGTPWNGKHRLGENKMIPLKAICLLERSQNNETIEINSSEIIKKIFNQIIIPKNPNTLDITLHLLSDLLSKVSLYKISCNVSNEAAEVAYKVIYSKN